jgi:hypothetical protein
MGRELIEHLIVQNFKLYQIDVNETETNFYGEAKKKGYKAPVDVIGRIEILDYDAELIGGLRRMAKGDMHAYVYNAHLAELEADIHEGDILDYMGKYYEVWDPGYNRDVNMSKLGATRDFYRQILASVVQRNVFEDAVKKE